MKVKVKKSILPKDNESNKIEKHKNFLFFRVYEEDKIKIYKTCLFQDIIKTALRKDDSNVFLITYSGLSNNKKKGKLKLYKKISDEFLGIYYDKESLEKPIFKEKEIKEIFHIEFRFKDGSVFLALNAIRKIIRKEYENIEYYEKFIEKIRNLEKDIYEFYSKKLENSIFEKYLKTFND